MARAVAAQLGVKDRQVLVCSTGRIGRDLPIEKIEGAVPSLVGALTENGSGMLARAMMTSDTFQKEAAIEFSVGSSKIRVGGIAKGAGMIDPNMATMLCVVATDARIAKRDLQKLFSASVEQSFNCITVDGDMSTNDTAICLANGQAGNELLRPDHELFFRFDQALKSVTRQLARMIVEDGEGTSKFVEVQVKGASTYQDARKVAEAVANSNLVKCSWHGEDPNWGRVMDAIGYSSAKVREEMIDIFFDGMIAAQNGVASSTPEQTLKEALKHKRFTLTIDLHLGAAEYKVYTTDLTPDYVRFNMSE
jgi:glutamate N-acetyltransferase/amino-acid N-acetyltransferase